MATMGHVIDVDKYEFKSNLTALDRLDGALNYLEEDDFQRLGLEFIDNGICEEQEEGEEVCEAIEVKHPAKLELLQENSQKGSSIITSNILTSCKTKQALIKVVDCDKFPWYYAKYENQILKRKYQNALEQARSILKYLKSSLAVDDTIVNIDDISDVENDNKEKCQKAYSRVNTIAIGKQGDLSKMETRNTDCPNTYTKSETQCINYTFDIKKNTGLIGIKVQTIDSMQVIGNNVRKKNLKKTANNDHSRKRKKVKEQPHKRGKESTSNEPDGEKVEPDCTEKLGNDSKDNKQPGSNRRLTTLPGADDTRNENCDVVARTKKYKPMPKSKKEKLIQQKLDQDNYKPNKTTKFIKCSKVSRDHVTAPKKSISVMNQLTKNVLKKINESSKRNDKNNYEGKINTKKSSDLLKEAKKLSMTNCNIGKQTDELSWVTSTTLKMIPKNTENPMMTHVDAPNVTESNFLHHKNHQDTDSTINNIGDSTLPTKRSTVTVHRTARLSTDIKIHSKKDPVEVKKFTTDFSKADVNQRVKILTPQSPINKRKHTHESHTLSTQPHIKASTNVNPKTPPISASPHDQYSLKSQEYIVPDEIKPSQILFDNRKTSLLNVGMKNDIAFACDQALSSSKNSGSTPQPSNTNQNTSRNIDISIYHQPELRMPINSQTPVIIRPVPVVTNPIKKPNLLKRSSQAISSNCDQRFQQTSANTPAMPHYTRNYHPPNFARPPLLNVPPWLVNQYRNPNYRYPNPNFRYPPTISVQRMPRNPFNQQPMFYNNNQHAYRQQSMFENMSHDAQMPPGICNIAPNNYNIALNQCHLVHIPKIPPPPPYTSNNNNSSIIGKNNTGFVKKISIPIPTTTNLEGRNYEKQEIEEDKNANKMANMMPVGNAAVVYTHVKQTREKANNDIVNFQNDETVTTKSDMLKELEQANTNIICHKNVESLKVTKPVDKRNNKQQLEQTEPKLVKQLPLPNTSKIQIEHSQKRKQDLKRPHSGFAKSELAKSDLIAQKLKVSKHADETVQRKKIQSLPTNVIDAIVKNLPLPEQLQKPLAESQATTVNNHSKRPAPYSPRAEKTNNLKTYRPGPLSKKRKHADVLITPPRDLKKVPAGNAYSPPILPIPTFYNFLSGLEEFQDNKASEDESANSVTTETKSSEKKKSPVIKSILRTKPKIPDISQQVKTKKISLEEYNKRSAKEQNEK